MAKENDKKIDKMIEFLESDFITKKEFNNSQNHIDKRFDEVMNILDKQTVILNRLDTETASSIQFNRRISKDIEKHDSDIKILKAKLNI